MKWHAVNRRPVWLLAVLLGHLACTADGPIDNSNNNGAGPQALQLSPSGRILAIIDPAGFDDLLARSSTESTRTLQPRVTAYVNLFAAQVGGDFDFVIFTLDAHRERLRFTPVGGFNITVQMPESGLGSFVSIPAFAALPRLRSYIYLARKDSLVLGPALHELAHAWGVRFDLPEPLGAQARLSDNHWGYTSVGGQMGGWMPGTLVDRGNGQYQLSRGNVEAGGRSFNTVPYAPLELYLMGLAGPEHVAPLEVAINPTFKSLFEFEADRIVTVSITDIIEANGPRNPATDQSQRHFLLAYVLLTDHVLSPSEWAFHEDSVEYFAAPRAANIEAAFPESRYGGQIIRDLITTPDPENAGRTNLNFFQATGGEATVEFGVMDVRTGGGLPLVDSPR